MHKTTEAALAQGVEGIGARNLERRVNDDAVKGERAR